MAIRLAATNDELIDTTSGVTTQPYSIIAWAKLVTDRNAYSTIFGIDGNATSKYIVFQTDTDGVSLYGYSETSTNSTTSHTALVPGAWYRVALVVTGTTLRTYMAPSTGTVTTFTTTTGTVTGTPYVRLGDSVIAGEWWNGSFANFKMYSAALTQAEIEAEWASWDTVRATNLVRHHRWRDAYYLTDDSGNSQSWTTSGSPTFDPDNPPISPQFFFAAF